MLSAPSQSAEEPTTHFSDLLFRGQSNSEWHLQTTLERWAGGPLSLSKYYRSVSIIHPEIESRTERRRSLIQQVAEYRLPVIAGE
jgi:hypothetical protein